MVGCRTAVLNQIQFSTYQTQPCKLREVYALQKTAQLSDQSVFLLNLGLSNQRYDLKNSIRDMVSDSIKMSLIINFKRLYAR